MSWRLLGISVLALAMGLVFGGLRVASAEGSAASFSRVAQLASLGQQVTGMVQALENERDETTGIAPIATTRQIASLQGAYDQTDAAAAGVRTLAAGVGGSFPTNIQAKVATVLSEATHLATLRTIAQASQSALSVIAAYATPIGDMISLNDEIAQGTSDAALANDVQALNTLSLAKDEAAQQRALMENALLNNFFADGELQALTTAQSVQATDQTAFSATATPDERGAFFNRVGGREVNDAESIETYIFGAGAVDGPTLVSGGFDPKRLPKRWFSDMSATIGGMQAVEQQVAGNIVARARVLQQGAQSSALITAVVTIAIMLIVAAATLLVTRSLVRPLRRLRAEALDIASVQLPERVRMLGESADAAGSLDIVPIDVTSGDEIGQVARAFDRVHAEAVRLAGNEAIQRTRYNAMFVNLSRRSQSLIERLVRLIDSLEQNEDDPTRLSSLFAMDHLVTRMRRNSENLLLLAGHEPARKRSEPAPLSDVARAAISEIEQYSRVTLNIQQGVSVAGSAVSDVVHLLAEVVENATAFSPRDTPVHMTAQQVSSGGVLVEVADSGVGMPEPMLAGINERLDNPPVMDVSVSRHMGLFAVGRLAERHGIRVRLRLRPPQGIIAMVWLPDSIILQGDSPYGRRHPVVQQIGVQGRQPVGAGTRPSLPAERPSLPFETAVSPSQFSSEFSSEFSSALPGQFPGEAPGELPGRLPSRVKAAAQSHQPTTRSAAVASSKWFSDPQARGNGAMEGSGAQSAESTVMEGSALGSAALGSASLGGGARRSGPVGNGGPPFPPATRPRGDLLGGAPLGGGPLGGGPAGGDRAGSEPVGGDQTSSGLPMRVPQANSFSGSADSTRRASHGMPAFQSDRREAQPPGHGLPQRSAETTRARLGGFQRGVRRGKSQPAGAGEGSDR